MPSIFKQRVKNWRLTFFPSVSFIDGHEYQKDDEADLFSALGCPNTQVNIFISLAFYFACVPDELTRNSNKPGS